MFVQVAEERLTLNCLTNDDKTILQEQCIDLTNKSLLALTDHNEIETDLQNNNDDFDVSLSLGPTDAEHPNCNRLLIVTGHIGVQEPGFAIAAVLMGKLVPMLRALNLKWPF